MDTKLVGIAYLYLALYCVFQLFHVTKLLAIVLFTILKYPKIRIGHVFIHNQLQIKFYH